MEQATSSYTIRKQGILPGSPLIRMACRPMVDQAVYLFLLMGAMQRLILLPRIWFQTIPMGQATPSYTICKPEILCGSPSIRMARSQTVDQAIHPSQQTDAI